MPCTARPTREEISSREIRDREGTVTLRPGKSRTALGREETRVSPLEAGRRFWEAARMSSKAEVARAVSIKNQEGCASFTPAATKTRLPVISIETWATLPPCANCTCAPDWGEAAA